MPRYLVMVDYPPGGGEPPIAGIYVSAGTKALAIAEVRAMLKQVQLTAYRREEDECPIPLTD